MTDEQIARIANGLFALDREWITGWTGLGGAAYNAIGEDLAEMGLLRGPLDWRLSETGERVKAYLEGIERHD